MSVFFIDALQQYLTVVQYDLRVVLLHDGLFGRKHIYSYVQGEGVWWKTVDTEVTEVTSNRSYVQYLSFVCFNRRFRRKLFLLIQRVCT